MPRLLSRLSLRYPCSAPRSSLARDTLLLRRLFQHQHIPNINTRSVASSSSPSSSPLSLSSSSSPSKTSTNSTLHSGRLTWSSTPSALPSWRRYLITLRDNPPPARRIIAWSTIPATALAVALFVWWLYPSDAFHELALADEASRRHQQRQYGQKLASNRSNADNDGSAVSYLSRQFQSLSFSELEWTNLSESIVDFILPEWSKSIPGYMRKLQRELSMAPGSLADEIWQEASDPFIHPEIQYSATVRVSDQLCQEEQEFLARRRMFARVALAKYLNIPESQIHPDDVPVMALCGSGGGLRALVASTGSLLATEEDGLLDCLTYTSGVSGTCWLQAMCFSSVHGGDRLDRLVDHLKSRLGVHIAYPPVAFQSLISAPTNKYLLSGIVEKLRGDPQADFGLVDIYGILLAARLLVPRGELGIQEKDFKLSNQRNYLRYGEHPMPIYTTVRHEIPDLDAVPDQSPSSLPNVSEQAKAQAKKEAWFQWFEITPYEFFCEEFSAGIPTWALGRKFKDGRDVPLENGQYLPELRMPLLLGVFGSAFCATLSHYYREIQPLVRSIAGFSAIDELISGHNEDLSKVHPIDPAKFPNFVYGMEGKLPKTTPQGVCQSEYLQLMDAGMSNNLPIYPLLRPGRNVDVLLAFDASSDTKTDNWLSVADGYARQRNIKGWPVGIGWPKPGETPEQTRAELDESANVHSNQEAKEKITQAKELQAQDMAEKTEEEQKKSPSTSSSTEPHHPTTQDLGYCTVWVGTTAEREADATDPPPPSKALDDSTSWKMSEPNAGIAIIYLPLLANPRVPGVDPGNGSAPTPDATPTASDYLSTWNFVYTPEQVSNVVALARANYDEGRVQIRACVRAVYERKRKVRLEREEAASRERYRLRVRQGSAHRLGEGDHFS